MPLVVAVTGHRPDKLGGWRTPNPIYIHVLNELKKAFEHYQPDYVLTGMALGVDQWAAEICLNLSIKYVAAIPFAGQESRWPPQSKAKYEWLLSRAAQTYIISPGGYSPEKMHIRNQWMVDNSQLLVAVWNGTPGGTGSTVAYAKSVQKPIYYAPVDPPDVPTPITGWVMGLAEEAKAQAQVPVVVGKKSDKVIEQEKVEAAAPFKRKVDLE